MDHGQLRQRLLAERQELKALAASLSEKGLGQSMSDAYAEFSMYDNHPADAGSEMFEREKDLGLRSHLKRQLQAIDHALERMDRGTYGVCEDCGRPIHPERLAAFPATTLCRSCKERQEDFDRSPRPVEEQVLNPPFGRSFRDDDTYAAYDGEDAWQDVGVYGTSETPQDVPGARKYDDLYRSRETPGAVEALEAEPVDPDADQPGA